MKTNKIFLKIQKFYQLISFLKMFYMIKNLDITLSKIPFGEKGDFITSPKISSLFSEIIAIWIIACWESFGKPKNFNIVELGPGDGSLTNILLKSFKKFPEFNSIKKIIFI